MRDDVAEGLRFMWRTPALRRITSILAVINFFYFAATSLLVLYNTQRLHSGSFTYAALFVGAATGTVLTRFYVSAVVARFGRVRALGWSFWFWTLSIIGLALTTTPWVAVLMYFFLGTGTGLWWALNTTIRQEITPTRLLGRMNAAYPRCVVGCGAIRGRPRRCPGEVVRGAHAVLRGGSGDAAHRAVRAPHPAPGGSGVGLTRLVAR